MTKENLLKKELLTVHEAAELLKVSVKTLHRWEEAGSLVPQRTEGKHRRYTKEQLAGFIRSKSFGKKIKYASSLSSKLGNAVGEVREIREARETKEEETIAKEPVALKEKINKLKETNEYLVALSKGRKIFNFQFSIFNQISNFKLLKSKITMVVIPGLTRNLRLIVNWIPAFPPRGLARLGERRAGMTKKAAGMARGKQFELQVNNVNLGGIKEIFKIPIDLLAAIDSPRRKILLGFFSIFIGLLVMTVFNRAGLLDKQKLALGNFFGKANNADQSISEYKKVVQTTLGFSILGESTTKPKFVLNVGIPSIFKQDADFLKNLKVKGKSVFEGNITAPNVLYSITVGEGLSITGTQTPKITNTGVLSIGGKTGSITLTAGTGITIDGTKITNSSPDTTQNTFKTIKVGSTTFDAGSTTDTLTFANGTGITITPDTSGKKLTVTASGSDLNVSGFYDDGTVVRLATSTDSVGIGTTNPSFKLDVSGNIGPSDTGAYDLGSSSKQFANIYGQNIYQNGTALIQYFQRTSGSLAPINITDSINLGATSTSSALVHLAGTSGENSFVNTGNFGIGTTNPGAKFDVAGDILINNGGTIDTRAAGSLTVGGTTQTGLSLGRTGIGTTINGNVRFGADILTFGGGETLTLTSGKNVYFKDDFSTDGAFPITLTVTANTNVTVPSTGTLLTNTASSNQTITSTQNSGTVLGITDSTAIGAAIKGLVITLSGTGASDQTGLEFNLSGATGTNLNDIVGSSSTWKVSRTGLGTFANFLVNNYASVSGSLAVGYSTVPGGVGNAVFSGNLGIGTTSPSTALQVKGQITAGSGNEVLTTAAGKIDADAIGLISGDGTGSSNSGSGLETNIDTLGLLQGCDDTFILKWNDSSQIWQCSADAGGSTAGIINVKEGDTLYTGSNTLKFTASDFNISQSGTEATIATDYTNSGITRKNVDENILGQWSFLEDVLIGSTATSSAEFGFLNLTNGTPVASFAANLIFSGARTIAGTSMSPLTIGNTNTGALILNPGGNIGIKTTAPDSFALQVAGNVGPNADITYDLGSSSLRWNKVYANEIIGGSSGVQGYWQRTSGLIGTANITDDLLIGGNGVATPSASTTDYFQIFGTGSNAGNASSSGILTLGTNRSSGIIETEKMIPLTIGSTTTGPIQLSPKGTTGLFVAGDGNVGIGTTGPTNRLHIIQASDAWGGGIRLQESGGSGYGGGFYREAGSTGAFIINNNGQDTVAIKSGNVGIGTTLPLAKLDINGAASVSGNLILAGGARSIVGTAMNSIVIGDASTGPIQLSPKGTTGLYVDGTGNVGIGNISPTVALDVTGTGRFSNGLTVSSGTVSLPAGEIGNTELAFSSVMVAAGTGISGGGNVGLGSTITITNAGVTSLTGTANQVNVSGSTGAITLSLPQDIATTSNVTFNNLNLTGYATASASLAVGYSTVLGGIGNAVFSGNVGIGTTSPIAKLDVLGSASLSANLSLTSGTSELRIYDQNYNYTGFKSPTDLTGTSNYIYTLPVDDGTSDQVLVTNGSGVLSWQTATGVGGVGDITSVTAGNGLTGGGTSGDVTLDIGAGNGITVNANDIAVNLLTSIDGTGGTSSNSGLEFQGASSNQLTLVQGCSDTQVLSWNDTGGTWDCATVGGIGGVGDITAVGSMTTGAAFATTDADDDWLGLGASAGRIAFDDQATDFVNILSAYVGIGTTNPQTKLDVEGWIRAGRIDVFQINGNTISTGSGTLTLAAGKTLTASNTLTFAGTDSTTITFQGTDTYVGRATTDTLTNKTYDTAGSGNVFRINSNQITGVTGTGNTVALGTSPTFTTSIIAPLVIGGTSANNTLTLEGNNTTGNTSSNANLIFKVGDSAATTAMTILNNGNIGIGTATPLGILNISGEPAGKALVILNQTGDQALFTASASGVTKFTISNSGAVTTGIWNGTAIGTTYGGTGDDTSVTTGVPYISSGNWQYEAALDETRGGTGLASYTTGDMLYASGTNILAALAGGAGNEGKVLTISSGIPAWTTAGGSVNFWQRALGALAPFNITDDVVFGGTATSSAKFGFLNMANGDPTATISSNLSLKVPTGATPVSTFNILNGGSLAFGTSPGGDAGITAASPALYIQKSGNVGIGTTGPGTKLDIAGTAKMTGFQLGTSTTSGYVLTADINGVGTWQAVNALPSGASGQTLRYDGANWVATNTLYNNGTFVGIGTTVPNTKLDVEGWIRANRIDVAQINGNIISTGSGTLTFAAGKTLTVSDSTTLNTNVITFGGTETLTLAATKNVLFADAFTTSGSYPITLTAGATTNVTLPAAGTLLTNSASVGQGITSTQNSGTVFKLFDSTNIAAAIIGQDITLSGTGVYDQTGLKFNLSGASGTNLNDIVGSGDTWKISTAGTATFGAINITGTGGAVGWWQRLNGSISPTNITDDLLVGGTATSSAKFGFLNMANGSPTATISSNLSLAVPTGATPVSTLNILNGGSLAFGASVGGDGGITAASPILYLSKAGNIGVGTTSPTGGKLHVVGQCVAKGTRIRRRRRRRHSGEESDDDDSRIDSGQARMTDDGQARMTGSQDDNYIEEDIPVEDIQPGDEVLSLNDKTGEFEWNKVEKTMDMGYQKVFGLKTSGGKYIQTTSEHPYLVQIKPPKVISGTFEVDISGRVEEINKDTFIALANKETSYVIKIPAKTKQILKVLHNKRRISKFGFQTYAHLIKMLILFSGYRVRNLIVDHDYSGNEPDIEKIIKAVYGDLNIAFESVGKGSPADSASNRANTKGVGINKVLTLEEYLENKKETQVALKGATDGTDHQECLPGFPSHRVSKNVYHKNNKLSTRKNFAKQNLFGSMGETKWTKVANLNVGDKIATVDGWEYVIEIEELDKVQTYDLQIANTHNFVGNDIVAHNTYINSTAANALLVENSGTYNNIFSVNGATGNVGIGTTGPGGLLHLYSTGNAKQIIEGTGPRLDFKETDAAADNQKWIFEPTAEQFRGRIFNDAESAASDWLQVDRTGTTVDKVVFPNGNVGIGTTVPLTALDVTGSASLSANMSLRGATTAHTFNILDGGSLAFGTSVGGDAGITAASPALYIQKNGNVGIGTTGPSYKLDVNGDIRIASGSDLYVGTIGLNDTASPTTSGGYLIGANDEFDNSASTTVQGVLNDLDAAITSGGAGSMWTLASGVIYPTTATNDFAVGGTTLASPFSVDESLNTVRIGEGSNSNAILNMYGSDADTGSITYTTNDSWNFSGGNIGIGTTIPLTALDIEGSASLSANMSLRGATTAHTFNILDGGSLAFGTSAGGDTGITAASPALYMSKAGNIGLGTTSPTGGKLHVVGQCVAIGTRIRRRKKRRKSSLRGGEDDEAIPDGNEIAAVASGDLAVTGEEDWIEEDIPVEDIKLGDEVLSLNDKTGEFEWNKVEKTMDMGIQTVYGLKTSGGKYIQTTSEHPFLVQTRLPRIISGDFQVDISGRIEEMNKDSFVSLANEKNSFTIKLAAKEKRIIKKLHKEKHASKFGFQIYAQLAVITLLMSGFRVNKLIIDKDYLGRESDIRSIISTIFPNLEITFKSVGKGSPADRAAHEANVLGIGINKILSTKQFLAIKKETKATLEEVTDSALFASECLRKSADHYKVSLKGQYHKKDKMSRGNAGLLKGFSLSKQGESLEKTTEGETRWIKVRDLKPGLKIRTIDGWEYIREIKEIGKVRTFDLQIANTHNFVGNDIVAHNTYINSSSANALLVENSGTYNNIFSVNGATGNVGIGTTVPLTALDVVGSASLSANISLRGATTAHTFNILDGGSLAFGASVGGDGGITAATPILYLSKAGNIGVGTTSPTGGKLDLTDTSNTAASFSLTNNTATTIGNGANTLGVLDLQSTSLTTGNFMNIELNALSSGKGINLTSTSTALSSGSLFSLDWSPTGSTNIYATGDLLSISTGNAYAFVGNLLNVKSQGSSVFSVSDTAVTSNLPTSFTAAGDVAVAYDLNFTNPTASYIKSAAPLYLQAGEVFNASDLNLSTYHEGSIILTQDNQPTAAATAYAVQILPTLTSSSNMTYTALYGTYNVADVNHSGAQATDLTTLYSNYTGLTATAGTIGTWYGNYIANPTGSGTVTTKYALVTEASSGNVGIGTTAPGALLDVAGAIKLSGTDNIILNANWLSGDGGDEGVYVNSGGNVGIGTTVPLTALDVTGSASLSANMSLRGAGTAHTFNILDGGSLAFGASVGGDGGITAASPILYLSKAGNIGVGTTSPTGGKLHVVGQCVTGDTLLKRRRRRRKGKSSLRGGEDDEAILDGNEIATPFGLAMTKKSQDDDYIWEEVEIKDIKEGDEILSLNTGTGEFEPHRVNGLMDMGIQEVFLLTTRSKLKIETTDNHPYLVLDEEKIQAQKLQKKTVFEVDQSPRIEDLEKDSIIALANEDYSLALKLKSETKRQIFEKLYKKDRKLFGPEVFSLLIVEMMQKANFRVSKLLIDKEYEGYQRKIISIIENYYPGLIIEFRSLGRSKSPAHKLSYELYTKKKRSGSARISMDSRLQDCFTPGQTQKIRNPHDLLVPTHYHKKLEMSSEQPVLSKVEGAKWIKVKHLKPGMIIATLNGWERISNIIPRGRKQTYDIEVANTHNFVGNDIVAHNTYINSSSANALLVENSGTYNNIFSVNGATGNVGIGTTSPTLGKLQVAGGNVVIDNNQWYNSLNAAGSGVVNLIRTDTGNNIQIGSDLVGGRVDIWNGYSTRALRISGDPGASGVNINAGNVGIGTTSPLTALDVAGSASLSANMSLRGATTAHTFNILDGGSLAFGTSAGGDTGITAATPALYVQNNGNVGVGTTAPSVPFEVKGTGTGANIAKFTDVNTTGCTLATGGTISCSSDIALKKNISDIEYGLDSVLNLQPIAFNWKNESDGQTKSLGFIAQEVEGIIPKLVTTDSVTGLKELNTIGLVPVLTKAIQELASQGVALQGQVASLLDEFSTKKSAFSEQQVYGAGADLCGLTRFVNTNELNLRTDSNITDCELFVKSLSQTLVSSWGVDPTGIEPVRPEFLGPAPEPGGPTPYTLSQLLTDIVNNQASLSAEVASLSSQLSVLSHSPEEGNPINTSALSANWIPAFAGMTGSGSALFIQGVLGVSTQSGTLTAINLDVEVATISADLTVLGRTTLADLGVTGNINNGLLTINGMATVCHPRENGDPGCEDGSSINTLAGNLYLQNEGLGGIDILNGKVTIDTKGNIATKGTVAAAKFEVDTTASASASLGSGKILAGDLEATINTTAVNTKSKVFVTATSLTGGQSLIVTKKVLGKSFTVSVEYPILTDIKFDWFIVDEKN